MEQLFEYFNRKLIETPIDLVRYKYVDALAIFYFINVYYIRLICGCYFTILIVCLPALTIYMPAATF